MNNGNLRIKVSIGNLTIELEGKSEIVIRQFEKIKESGLGKIVSEDPTIRQAIKNIEIGDKVGHEPPQSVTVSQETQYEVLNNIVMKQLPGAETEWILIYAFYSSNFGENKFNRNHLLAKYEETNRASSSRRGNLSNNIKTLIRNNWIMAISSTDFTMTDEGIRMAEKILDRKGPR